MPLGEARISPPNRAWRELENIGKHTELVRRGAREANILDQQGVLTKAPPALGSKSLSELLANGTLRFDVDQKYPQALGIDSIIGRVSIFGNSQWEIQATNGGTCPKRLTSTA